MQLPSLDPSWWGPKSSTVRGIGRKNQRFDPEGSLVGRRWGRWFRREIDLRRDRISAPAQEGKAAKIINLCQRLDDCSAASGGAKHEIWRAAKSSFSVSSCPQETWNQMACGRGLLLSCVANRHMAYCVPHRKACSSHEYEFFWIRRERHRWGVNEFAHCMTVRCRVRSRNGERASRVEFSSVCVYTFPEHLAPLRTNSNTTLIVGSCVMMGTCRTRRVVTRELW